MKKYRFHFFLACIALFAALWIANEPVRAELLARAQALNGAPQVVNYQGQVTVAGAPYTGTGYFKLAVLNQAGNVTYWTNDGTASGQPAAAVSTTVTNGLFTILLGDTTLPNMQALPASVFNTSPCYLRAWFSKDNTSFIQLAPDRRIVAVPFALQAEEAKTAGSSVDSAALDGLQSGAFQQHYANTLVVAKSGGDFTTISAALASITTANASNPYLIQVLPGVYSETVTMKSYVDIEGSGELTTKITAPGSAIFATGTVVGAANAELRHITVENTGGAADAIAIYNAPRLAFVTIKASGGTSGNYGIYNAAPMRNVTITATGGMNAFGMTVSSSLAGFNPQITNVVIIVSGATTSNTGINGGSEILRDATITVSGGQRSYGVQAQAFQSSPTLIGVTIDVSGATVENVGVYNFAAMLTTLRNCTISVRGTSSYGVFSVGFGADHKLMIHGSQISGATSSVYGSSFPTWIGASQLLGGAITSTPTTCAGVYDESNVFYANTCP
jgi:hypothetical protein